MDHGHVVLAPTVDDLEQIAGTVGSDAQLPRVPTVQVEFEESQREFPCVFDVLPRNAMAQC